VRKRRGQGG
jgi:hypothetical protein